MATSVAQYHLRLRNSRTRRFSGWPTKGLEKRTRTLQRNSKTKYKDSAELPSTRVVASQAHIGELARGTNGVGRALTNGDTDFLCNTLGRSSIPVKMPRLPRRLQQSSTASILAKQDELNIIIRKSPRIITNSESKKCPKMVGPARNHSIGSSNLNANSNHAGSSSSMATISESRSYTQDDDAQISRPAAKKVALSAIIRSSLGNKVNEERTNQMESIKMRSASFSMKWSQEMKASNCIVSDDQSSVCFHPYGSRGGAVCLADKPLPRNGNYYYWEIKVYEKVYGTSVMFGLCTRNQSLEVNNFYNVIGLDNQGWSLSHKGLVWHAGSSRPYTRPFPSDQPILLGLLFNTTTGQLCYFMNGRNLGVAFFGLNEVEQDLYPCVGSTSKKTVMQLVGAYFGLETLMQRSCYRILQQNPNHGELFDYLENKYKLPKKLLDHLKLESTNRNRTSSRGQRTTDEAQSDEESPFANIHTDLIEPLYAQYMADMFEQYHYAV